MKLQPLKGHLILQQNLREQTSKSLAKIEEKNIDQKVKLKKNIKNTRTLQNLDIGRYGIP